MGLKAVNLTYHLGDRIWLRLTSFLHRTSALSGHLASRRWCPSMRLRPCEQFFCSMGFAASSSSTLFHLFGAGPSWHDELKRCHGRLCKSGYQSSLVLHGSLANFPHIRMNFPNRACIHTRWPLIHQYAKYPVELLYYSSSPQCAAAQEEQVHQHWLNSFSNQLSHVGM